MKTHSRGRSHKQIDDSTTLEPRPEAVGAPRTVPLLLFVGDNGGGWLSPSDQRVWTFPKSLVLGRKEMLPNQPGQKTVVVKDRMVSGQHFAISPGSGEGTFELTDLSSTNGTIVDGHLVETTVPLRDGSIIFFGSQAAVFRVVSTAALSAIEADRLRPFLPVPTVNPGLATICHKLRKLAEAGREILLTGETGVGKEVCAAAIHRASGRAGDFVAVNCAALPGGLVETELFGYAKGGHSQAAMAKHGIIERAAGGTLFLDEVGDMAPELQAKLLRFTQDRVLRPIGCTSEQRIDTLIIAATNRTAESSDSDRAGLRSDLAARLGAEPIRIPPLRERIEDLGALARYLSPGTVKAYDLPAFQALCLYHWPGNVRELSKVVAAGALLSSDLERIGLVHIPQTIAAPSHLRPSPRRRTARPPPKSLELQVLMHEFDGNVMRVARELDRKPALIYRWAKRFGLNVEDFRPKSDA